MPALRRDRGHPHVGCPLQMSRHAKIPLRTSSYIGFREMPSLIVGLRNEITLFEGDEGIFAQDDVVQEGDAD